MPPSHRHSPAAPAVALPGAPSSPSPSPSSPSPLSPSPSPWALQVPGPTRRARPSWKLPAPPSHPPPAPCPPPAPPAGPTCSSSSHAQRRALRCLGHSDRAHSRDQDPSWCPSGSLSSLASLPRGPPLQAPAQPRAGAWPRGPHPARRASRRHSHLRRPSLRFESTPCRKAPKPARLLPDSLSFTACARAHEPARCSWAVFFFVELETLTKLKGRSRLLALA